MAKAVVIKGKAEMVAVGSGKTVHVEAGPWQGEHTPEHLMTLLGNRYSLSARDGALGFSHESFGELFARPEGRDSQLFKDNEGRVITKIRPQKIQAWDFSKAPMGLCRVKRKGIRHDTFFHCLRRPSSGRVPTPRPRPSNAWSH